MERPLDDVLVAAVLARLGFAAAPARTADGLATLYRAWCRRVPWDNVRKRIAVASGQAPLAGAHPEDFFAAWLAHGTGGTCWPSSGALHALLLACGFDARRLTGAMAMHRFGLAINHASIIVRVGGEELLVDTSILNERPLPLRHGETTAIDDALHPVRAEPTGLLWTVWWRAHSREEDIPCLLLEDGVPLERYLERYEDSRVTGFSYGLVLAAGRPEGVVSLRGHKRVFRDRSGALALAESVDRARVLVEEIGLSPEIVAALPEDVPDPIRQPSASA